MRITTHPGDYLYHEYMLPLGLSSNALAKMLQIPANRISDIVRERRGITADTAMRLAEAFETSPEFWMNLQSNHDLSKGMAELQKRRAEGREMPIQPIPRQGVAA